MARIGGIAAEDIHGSTLQEIAIAFETEQFRLYLLAQPHLMAYSRELSPLSLAEAEERDAALAAKDRAEQERKIKRGLELKARHMRSIDYAMKPPFQRSAHVRAFGHPGDDPDYAPPLQAISAGAASAILVRAKRGEFDKTFFEFWEQYKDPYQERLMISTRDAQGD